MKKYILFLFAIFIFVSCEKPKINTGFGGAIWEINYNLTCEDCDTVNFQRKFIFQANFDGTLTRISSENYLFDGVWRYYDNQDTLVWIGFKKYYKEDSICNNEFEYLSCAAYFIFHRDSISCNFGNAVFAIGTENIWYQRERPISFTATGKRIKNL